jgi:hypothetical protein
MPDERYPCPCCGFVTLTHEPPGSYDICPVCYWEDDPVQFNDPAYEGGANRVNLEQARTNFSAFGASEEVFLQHVRRPTENERP